MKKRQKVDEPVSADCDERECSVDSNCNGASRFFIYAIALMKGFIWVNAPLLLHPSGSFEVMHTRASPTGLSL